MRYTIVLFVLCFFTVSGLSQEISSTELLKRSIAFHDPDDLWGKSKLELVIALESPEISNRISKVTIDNINGTFQHDLVSDGRFMSWKVAANDSCEATLNFMEVEDTVLADSLGLNAERGRMWRDYYSYLYGLPMKLKDQGTNIDPEVSRTEFNGEEVLSIRVTYDKTVGSDIWYFYFHPETYALRGYRFYHDESINDGEYILLNGVEVQNGLRIPKDRTWYTNAEDKLLGSDFLRAMRVKR